MTQFIFFLASWLLLAGLLFVPVSKLVWVMSVRRLERGLNRDLTEDERAAQLNRARFVSVLLVMLFSLLFNAYTLGIPGRG